MFLLVFRPNLFCGLSILFGQGRSYHLEFHRLQTFSTFLLILNIVVSHAQRATQLFNRGTPGDAALTPTARQSPTWTGRPAEKGGR